MLPDTAQGATAQRYCGSHLGGPPLADLHVRYVSLFSWLIYCSRDFSDSLNKSGAKGKGICFNSPVGNEKAEALAEAVLACGDGRDVKAEPCSPLVALTWKLTSELSLFFRADGNWEHVTVNG